MIEAGRVIDGRYRLEALIGEGGMGTVWRAHHLELDAPVAIKLVRKLTSDTALARFKREARAAAKLRSQHVVQVFDHGVADDMPYIVMELLAGESLAERLNRAGKLEPEALEPIFKQMARAVDRAHELGIVHRDLKPSNVHLVVEGDGEIVKILDFGIAKMTDSIDDASTQTGALMGTPYYMSPEQLSDSKHVQPSADLWALAIIAYEALLGRRPFTGATVGAVAMKLAAQPPVPSEQGPVPAGFDVWFAKATARHPSERFASAKEMAEALSDALSTPMADEALEATVTVADGRTPEVEQARSVVTRTAERPAEASSSSDRWRMWGWPLAVVAVAGMVYLTTKQPAGGETQTTIVSSHYSVVTSAEPVTSAAAAIEESSAFPCAELDEPNERASCSKEGYVAWCDRGGKQVACCGKGLVPADSRGACGCPEGGTTEKAAQEQGCAASEGLDREAFQRLVRSHWGGLKNCYEAALKRNDKLSGRISVRLKLDARGHIWDLRFGESALPDPVAQRCLLEVWQAMDFVPPPNGYITIGYPLLFGNE